MKNWILVLFVLAGFFTLSAGEILAEEKEMWQQGYWQLESNRQARDLYIERYYLVAMEEMRRVGIPASIKLAQGLLESDAGRSDLALKANNHFGIKCGGDWQGPTYYKKDDDYKNGKLVASCFRSYKDSDLSFVAHSAFLSDPKKVARYGFLFNLDPMDYKAWAHGLRKSGYATNPKYGHLLISLIEDLELHRYDKQAMQEQKAIAAKKTDKGLAQALKGEVNGVPVAYAVQGQTLEQLAKKEGIKVRKLERYNEGLWLSKQTLPAEERIFLSRKRKKFQGAKKFHYTKEEETLLSIAQNYGVRSSSLAKRNKVEATALLHKGQRVKLKGWFAARKAPSVVTRGDAVTNAAAKLKVHKVESGDTLFGLSRRYGVSVQDLKMWNQLMGDSLQVGQTLLLESGL